jgi:hypothetical protein
LPDDFTGITDQWHERLEWNYELKPRNDARQRRTRRTASSCLFRHHLQCVRAVIAPGAESLAASIGIAYAVAHPAA